MGHTPKLPFKLGGCSGRMIEDAEGYLTCDCDLLANAKFIVRACNTHAKIVKQRDALKGELAVIKAYEEDCKRRGIGYDAYVANIAKDALAQCKERE